MFSNWFSSVSRGDYRTSPHKQRIDHLGSSLLKLRYAPEVVRQHLHEWLRFSLRLDKEGALLPAPSSDSVKQYLGESQSPTLLLIVNTFNLRATSRSSS